MNRALVGLALVAALLGLVFSASAQFSSNISPPRGCRSRDCLRDRVTSPDRAYALFEFAPDTGAGMTGVCDGAVPTGAKGEAMTFTRASSATCMRGGIVTGIANGDMVTLSSNQPRVMSGGVGVVGLFGEGARTNLALRSEEIDNAAWVKSNTSSADPVVTADYATAPDGTLTAERVQFSACSSADSASIISQVGLGTTGRNAASVYCRGTSATQTLQICVSDSGGTNDACVPVTCPSTSWTRMIEVVSITTSGGPVVGCNNLTSTYAGASNTGAADVLLWGGQFEVAGSSLGSASSYIKTASASAARAVESAKVTMIANFSSPTASWGSTVVTPGPAGSGIGLRVEFDPTNNILFEQFFASTRHSTIISGTVTPQDVAVQFSPYVENKMAGYYNGTSLGSCMRGTCAATARSLTLPSGAPNVWIGMTGVGTTHAFGVVKQVCFDPSPSRCL